MTISISKTVYSSCASGGQKVRTDNAVRAQGARTTESNLNIASMIPKSYSDQYGRSSSSNATGTSSGTQSGSAGTSSSEFIIGENTRRQVGDQTDCTRLYDTIAGTNRSGAPTSSTSGGVTVGNSGGASQYTNVPL